MMEQSEENAPRPGSMSARVREKLRAGTPRSAALNRANADVLANEIVPTVEMAHPVYIERAEGATLTDVDGNRYIDLTMGFGACVLGHSPAVVREAIGAQAKAGWHFGIHNTLQGNLAERIQAAGACVDLAVFCNSGSEATGYAMRVARAHTGKTRVALFDGSYHGAHDYALIQADRKSPRSRPTAKALGQGVPRAIVDETMLVLPYRDPAAFDLIREHRDTLALVMIEPVQSSNPRGDTRDFLHELREVCRQNGVLFLLDEVITGFRIAYGGGQEYFGLKPDLATYGKAIGGGLPIGAVGGRGDIMTRFAAQGEGSGSIYSGGTFSGNPLVMAAGLAAVDEMAARREALYPALAEKTGRFAHAVNEFCRGENLPAQMMHLGSMFHLRFQAGPIESSRDFTREHAEAEREFYLHLIGHGVIVPGVHLAFFSAAHSGEDVDAVIAAFQQSFRDLRTDGLI